MLAFRGQTSDFVPFFDIEDSKFESGLDGLNWYLYVGNNPLVYVDPTGLEDIKNESGELAGVVFDENNQYLTTDAQRLGYENWQEAAEYLGISDRYNDDGSWKAGAKSLEGIFLLKKEGSLEGISGKDQMKYLGSRVEQGSHLMGGKKGSVASELRSQRVHFELKELFKLNTENNIFMNENLRDFLNLREDGTMNYPWNELTENNGWTEMQSLGSQHHNNNMPVGGNYNAKFVNADGREIVMNRFRQLVTDFVDRGTFNYVNGTASSSILWGGHKLYDMNPYFDQMDRANIQADPKYYPATWDNINAHLERNSIQWRFNNEN